MALEPCGSWTRRAVLRRRLRSGPIGHLVGSGRPTDVGWLMYPPKRCHRRFMFRRSRSKRGSGVCRRLEGAAPLERRQQGALLFSSGQDTHGCADTFHAGAGGRAVPLFRTDVIGFFGLARSDYAPSADGKRFLLNNRVGNTLPQTIHVMTDWLPEAGNRR